MHPMLGLMRIGHLRSCLPLLNITGADLVLLCDLALRGDFVHAVSATWSRREFRQEIRYEDKLHRYATSTVIVKPSLLQRIFPLASLPVALSRVVARSALSFGDKAIVMFVLLASFPVRYLVGRRTKSTT